MKKEARKQKTELKVIPPIVKQKYIEKGLWEKYKHKFIVDTNFKPTNKE